MYLNDNDTDSQARELTEIRPVTIYKIEDMKTWTETKPRTEVTQTGHVSFYFVKTYRNGFTKAHCYEPLFKFSGMQHKEWTVENKVRNV